MSEALDLLNGLSEEELAAYSAEPDIEEHVVIGKDRVITVPESLKKIAVQHDHNIETVTFDCPRYWDEHDLSQMLVCINYINAAGALGSYIATDITVDEADDSIFHFTWTISGNVTAKDGTINFLVCTKTTDEDGRLLNHWNSELNSDMYVSKGLECVAPSEQMPSDLLTQVLLLNDLAMTRAGVYVGSGEMPDWATVQIDPDGEASDVYDSITLRSSTGSGRMFKITVNDAGALSVNEIV